LEDAEMIQENLHFCLEICAAEDGDEMMRSMCTTRPPAGTSKA
jgi:hypothetical protein